MQIKSRTKKEGAPRVKVCHGCNGRVNSKFHTIVRFHQIDHDYVYHTSCADRLSMGIEVSAHTKVSAKELFMADSHGYKWDKEEYLTREFWEDYESDDGLQVIIPNYRFESLMNMVEQLTEDVQKWKNKAWSIKNENKTK